MVKYCSNCWQEIATDAMYCSHCGQRKILDTGTGKQTYYKTVDTNYLFEKDNLISELERTELYFKQKQSSYDKFNDLNKKKENLKGPSGCAVFFWGVVLAFIVYFFIAFNFYELDGWLLTISTFVVFGIILPINYVNKKNLKINNQIEYISQQLETIETDLRSHYNAYNNCKVSFEYSDPKVIEILKHNISSGRSDSIKESINCLLDDIHKQKMLVRQDEIAKNAKDAANVASASALFSAGILLNTRKK